MKEIKAMNFGSARGEAAKEFALQNARIKSAKAKARESDFSDSGLPFLTRKPPAIKANRGALAFAALLFCFCALNAPAEIITARALAEEAAKMQTAAESVNFIKATIPSLQIASEKRAAFAFLGSVQEQLGFYTDACASFATAAGIQASDAKGMPKKSNEQLVLDAVRCALCAGDTSTADSYLNSEVRNSSNANILALIKLYEQWSALCRAETVKDTEESVALLKTYATLDSMKSVAPSVILTLWHVTGEAGWAEKLKEDFPGTPECALVKGEIQQLPTPFWYFVPREGGAVPEVEAAVSSVSASADTDDSSSPQKALYLQLGLFREESNAKSLVAQLKTKGFDARITTETAKSGNVYYLVIVDDNAAGTMSTQLRTAGFDCYPVF